MHDAIYVRIKALCCSSWSISPDQFDWRCEQELIAAEDGVECITLAAFRGEQPLSFIFREAAFDRRRKVAELQHLAQMIRIEKDDTRRRELAARMEALNN